MNPNQETRHDLAELEREEALMEAEDIAQAEFDQRKADYIQELLTGFRNGWMWINGTTKERRQYTNFHWEVWQDWFDSLDNNVIELVRLNLACGDREKAGLIIIESIEAYMDEIAAQAVREQQ